MAKQHSARFLKIVDASKTRIRECTIDDIKNRLETDAPFILVDVREESEWARGRLPNAIHLGKGVIERDIEAAIPELDAEIVLYCGGGYRSALAADVVQQMGYTNVISMDGGYREWKEAALPIETDD